MLLGPTGPFAHRRRHTMGDPRPLPMQSETRPELIAGGSRATSGDPIEPHWDELPVLRVGTRSGDIQGRDEKAIQAAVDWVSRMGGGTVRLFPGTFRLRNAVFLHSRVRLIGSGAETVLIKEPSVSTSLAQDTDWYDQEITLAESGGFQVGDGVCLRAKNPHNQSVITLKRTLVARSGNRFKLDRAPRENFWQMGQATASTLFPLLTAEFAEDLHVEDLVLDGNRANNENLDGNYAGCIFLQDCRKVVLRNVEARYYNGDGISWQITHDVLVEECHSHDNAGLGLHPGSGSQRPVICGNRIERNDIGLFFCWGVKFGVAEGNRISESGSYGLSIGHRDTDNLIRDNEISGSGRAGVLFRPERGKSFQPHRNRLEANRILDSGAAQGAGIEIQGEVEGIILERNELRESRGPAERVGIRIGEKVGKVTLKENRLEGFARSVLDQRSPADRNRSN